MRTSLIARGLAASLLLVAHLLSPAPSPAEPALPRIAGVEGQPLGANARRVLQAFETLGTPLPQDQAAAIDKAAEARDADRLQELLDPHVLCAVAINPELRVKVLRGPAAAALQQGGFTPFVIKVINEATLTRPLRFSSPQAGPLYSGASLSSLTRQAQPELNENENKAGATDRFLQVEMLTAPPLTKELSGLKVEYVVALLYSQEAGRREATLAFDVGAGTQDLGFRGEVPVLFQIQHAIPVRLSIRDHDDSPTVGCLTFRDRHGRVYPPQAKRLAPDFFFQPHIYRPDDGVVLLPPGEFKMEYSRGPEYTMLERTVQIPAAGPAQLDVRLQRWVNPQAYGFYCGDHHIHGAGCAHYESPTQGVTPEDMFLQVKGEGLNVGCVLTWGPCFDFQRQYFAPVAHDLSEPLTVLKYDLEISGFGSAPLGHVCLLNLRNQTYPGSESTKGWPTWTVPVLRWTKEQGGVTGYPHSALQVDPPAAAKRMLGKLDRNADGLLDAGEAENALLPESFAVMDADRDQTVTEIELVASHERAADVLPNLVSPEMNGGGALEICVSTAEGVCDFVSAMDTPRLSEWNTWYHLLNCGFPLKVSGETDFPCMSSRRVGQGRVYVQLGQQERVDFSAWCTGLAEGRSYVSDGFGHALQFTVAGKVPGPAAVRLDQPGKVTVTAKVAFSPETPKVVAQGEVVPVAGRRLVGDTRVLHAPRTEDRVVGGERLVEIVVNGRVAASARVPADGREHDLEFTVPIERSSWVALRHFPQLHTNPVTVLVAGQPLRISRNSARWCAETIEQLWDRRHQLIAEPERAAAHAAYQRALERFRQIASQCPEGS